MSVRADAEQVQREAHAAERGVVLGGGLIGGGFAPNAMDGTRLHREVVEERALCHPIVGVVVVGRHTALVAPPQLGGAPVRLGHRRRLVRERRALAAGKGDVPARPSRLGEEFAHALGGGTLVAQHDQFD